jgi:hypothetical protein
MSPSALGSGNGNGGVVVVGGGGVGSGAGKDTKRISRRAVGRIRHSAGVALSRSVRSGESRTRTLAGKLARTDASRRNRVARRAHAE